MRNIITILFVILSINLNAQTVGRLPYGITIQSFKGDTLKTSVKNTNNYTEFYTNKGFFEFKKPITIQSSEYSVIDNLQSVELKTNFIYFSSVSNIIPTDNDLNFTDPDGISATLKGLKNGDDISFVDDILDFGSSKYTPYVGLPEDNTIPRLFTVTAGFDYTVANFQALTNLNTNVFFRAPKMETNGIVVNQSSYVGVLGETTTGGVFINSIYNGGAGLTLVDMSTATLQGEPLIKITQKANAARPTINLINKIQDTATVFNYNDRVKIKGSGFTQLGEVAPAIKTKKLTGTTPPVEGMTGSVLHGLTGDKIISVTAKVMYTTNYGVTPNYTFEPGYEYNLMHDNNNVLIRLDPINSENILSKPFIIYITYEE